jgi:hypothetical protein
MSDPAHPSLSSPPPQPSWFAGEISVFAIVLLVGSLLLALQSLISIPFVFERNYNEGWNIYNTQRFFTHEIVYDDNLWRVNNYPPVSFLVVGGVDLVVGDLLRSGRLVALVSFAALGVLAAIATARLGANRTDALLAGGCALGFCYLAAPAWVATDDPQTLAEAIMLGGFVVYLAGPASRARLLATAGIVMLAGFTKHNLVAIPVAITLDLAIRRSRHLWFWLAACASLAVIFWALTVLGAGGSFLAHVLQPRPFAWWSVEFHLLRFVLIFAAPIVPIVWFLSRVFTRDRLVLAAYGTVSIVSAAVLSGFEGVSYNVYQDAAVFLAIAAGLLVHELRRWEGFGVASTGVATAVLALVPLLIGLPIVARVPQAVVDAYPPGRPLQASRDAQRSFLADAAYVADRHGPAICESLLLCYRAGQPFRLDPFNSRQYVLAGRLDQAPLLARVAAKEFAVVQLRAEICDGPAAEGCSISHDPPKYMRFTDELLYAIDRHYRIDRRSPLGVFYVPR